MSDDYSNWEPQHRSSSHPGIVGDGSGSFTFGTTTMKDEYRIPVKNEISTGRRKQLLRTFLWQQFAKKYVEELSRPEVTDTDEPPISAYKESFNCGGFKVKDNLIEDFTTEQKIEIDNNINIPLNKYYFLADDIKRLRVSNNPSKIFRRVSKFCKPWYAPLE